MIEGDNSNNMLPNKLMKKVANSPVTFPEIKKTHRANKITPSNNSSKSVGPMPIIPTNKIIHQLSPATNSKQIKRRARILKPIKRVLDGQ